MYACVYIYVKINLNKINNLTLSAADKDMHNFCPEKTKISGAEMAPESAWSSRQ